MVLRGRIQIPLMGSFVRILFLVPIVLLIVQQGSLAQTNLRVDMVPKAVKQGNVCLVRVSSSQAIQSLYGEFRGEKFPLISGIQDGTYEGLVGIDLRMNPGTHMGNVIVQDEGGEIHKISFPLKVEKASFGTEKLSLPASMVHLDKKTLQRVNEEAHRLETLFQRVRGETLWRGAFILPVKGRVSSGFGLTRIINGQQRSPHTGVDLEAEEGSPVLASNTGVAVLVGELFFSGKSLILDHGWGCYSMYFHLSEVAVKEGDRVARGSEVGRVGSTGRSTGPHLHWAIRIRQARVDPLSLLTLADYLGE